MRAVHGHAARLAGGGLGGLHDGAAHADEGGEGQQLQGAGGGLEVSGFHAESPG